MIYILPIYIIYTMETNNKTTDGKTLGKCTYCKNELIYKNNIEEFFVKRFKRCPCCDKTCFEEWVQRFAKGTAYCYADLETRRVLKKICGIDAISD